MVRRAGWPIGDRPVRCKCPSSTSSTVSSCKHLTESDQTGHVLSRPLTSCCEVRGGMATGSGERTVSQHPRVRFSHISSTRSGTSRWYERDAAPNRQRGTSQVLRRKPVPTFCFSPLGLSNSHTTPQRRADRVGQPCSGTTKEPLRFGKGSEEQSVSLSSLSLPTGD